MIKKVFDKELFVVFLGYRFKFGMLCDCMGGGIFELVNEFS